MCMCGVCVRVCVRVCGSMCWFALDIICGGPVATAGGRSVVCAGNRPRCEHCRQEEEEQGSGPVLDRWPTSQLMGLGFGG